MAEDISSRRAAPRRGTTRPAAEPAARVKDSEGEAARAADERLAEERAIEGLRNTVFRDEPVRMARIVDEIVRRLGSERSLGVGSINVINEVSVAEGDFRIGGRSAHALDGSSARPEPVGAAEVGRLLASFVRPPGFVRAKEILATHHLVVLAAPRGTGRETAALALLADVTDRTRLHVVGRLGLDGEARWAAAASGAGYLLGELDVTAARRLDDRWLRDMTKRLADAGSFLVVVTGEPTGSLATASSRAEVVVEDLGMPDPVAVARRRARVVLRTGRMPELDAYLADREIAELFAEDASPRFASRLAVTVAEAMNKDEDVTTALTALLDPVTRAAAWFRRFDSAEEVSYPQLAFAAAVAVLDGCGYFAVTDAAIALCQELRVDEKALRLRRSLRTEQRWISTAVPDGPAATEVVRFRNPRMQAAVLHHVWTSLDGLRPALVRWHKALGEHADVEVRARAAVSAGLLATLDFAYSVRQFLRPWALSASPATRTSAAAALAVPGGNPRYLDRVQALLVDWVHDESDGAGNRLAWTAAEAAGSALCESAPDRGLDVLGKVLDRDDWDCLLAISFGVLNLVEGGAVQQVLRALLGWSDSPDDSARVVKALLVFVIAARTPPPPNAAEDAAGEERRHAPEPWPVLLQNADRHRTALRDLWARALATATVRPLALEALRGWLRIADRDPAARAPVTGVFEAVAALGGRHHQRVEYHLSQWAAHPTEPSVTAGRALATIGADDG